MAAKFLTIAIVTVFCAHSGAHIATSGYTPFAATYNAHAINHAVAYPVGPKVVAPTASPAVISKPVSVATLPTTVVTTTTPAATVKPALAGTPATGDTSVFVGDSVAHQVPFTAAGQQSFASTPFGFVAPAFGAHSPVFVAGSAYGPAYGALSAYAPAYSAATAFAVPPHAFASRPGAFAVAPAYAGASYAISSSFAPGSVALTAGTPVPAKVPVSANQYAFW